MASDSVPPSTVNGGNQEAINNDAATIAATIEGPSENEPLQKKCRKKTSKVWDELETVYENGTRKAKCTHCKTSLSLGRGAPTTHLKRHLLTCAIRQASVSGQTKGPTQQLLALSSTASDGSVTISGGLASYKFDKEKDYVSKDVKQSKTSSESSNVGGTSNFKGKTKRVNEFDLWAKQLDIVHPYKFELEIYLEEGIYIRDENDTEDFDALSWWKANTPKFRNLSKMARDILSIPITSVASESAFSAGGRVLDQYRSSLKPETVQALICTGDWLRNDFEIHESNIVVEDNEFMNEGSEENNF